MRILAVVFDLFVAAALAIIMLVHTTGDWVDFVFVGSIVFIYLALCWLDTPKRRE